MKQILSSDQVREGIKRLASQVRETYGQRPLTIVAILTGSLVLLADLIRQLEMPLRVAVIQSSRIRTPDAVEGDPIPGNDLTLTLKDRHVLVIDDIFDTGHTLVEVLAKILPQEPASVRSAVLMRKMGRAEVALCPDFVVFDIPDEFVVGYGLDFEDRYRNLPFVAALEPNDLVT